MRHGLDVSQLHHAACQQPQAPPGTPYGRLPRHQSDQVSFDVAVHPASYRRGLCIGWSVPARPMSTNCFRTRSTVARPQHNDSAISASVFASPPSAWSASKRIRARRSFRAAAIPAETSFRRPCRSSSVSTTRYCFLMTPTHKFRGKIHQPVFDDLLPKLREWARPCTGHPAKGSRRSDDSITSYTPTHALRRRLRHPLWRQKAALPKLKDH